MKSCAKVPAHAARGIICDSRQDMLSRQVKATAPATIWGQQVLAQRRDRPANDFEAKTVLAYLRGCGIVGATYSTAFSGLDVIHTFRL